MKRPLGNQPLRGTALKRFHRAVRRAHDPSRRVALVLEHVNYPVNVGSLFRIADACRAEQVALTGTTPDPDEGRTVARVSRGKHLLVPWQRYADGPAAVHALRALGFWVAALEITEDAMPYHEVTYPNRTALVVGNEDHGVTRATLAECDACVFVPMLGRGASLNVHVAAAVVAYRALWSPSGERPSTPST